MPTHIKQQYVATLFPYYLLVNFISESKGTPEKEMESEKLRIVKQIAEGMRCLHDHGIPHLRLRSANIVVCAC